LVDLADGGKLDSLGMFIEREEVVLGDPAAAYEADTDLAVTDDRVIVH
jgi:hypothetical protein